MDIRSIYLDPRLRSADGFVPLTSWDSNLATILPAILGPQVMFGQQPNPAAVIWWKGILQPLINSASKAKKRCDSKLKEKEKKLEELLGTEFGSFELKQSFTLPNARKILKILLSYSDTLSWTAVSIKDRALMSKKFDIKAPNLPKRIQKRWETLSKNAQRHEYSLMMIGWMTGVIERKTQNPLLDLPDFEQEDVAIGM